MLILTLIMILFFDRLSRIFFMCFAYLENIIFILHSMQILLLFFCSEKKVRRILNLFLIGKGQYCERNNVLRKVYEVHSRNLCDYL